MPLKNDPSLPRWMGEYYDEYRVAWKDKEGYQHSSVVRGHVTSQALKEALESSKGVKGVSVELIKKTRDSSSRRTRLHAALDCLMDKCGMGVGGDATPGSRDACSKCGAVHSGAHGKGCINPPKVKDASDYCLTARDEGFLRSLLEHGTNIAKAGLGAMSPTEDLETNRS